VMSGLVAEPLHRNRESDGGQIKGPETGGRAFKHGLFRRVPARPVQRLGCNSVRLSANGHRRGNVVLCRPK
jgi:hypothetical protein